MPLKYRLDYSDLQTPLDDGKRYELAWGTLLVTPSPSLDHQAPLLVIEILSPATRDRDRGLKAVRYAELGVANYWIVDPDARRIECFRLEEGAYVSIAASEGDGLLFHPDWEGLAIDAFALWRV